MHIYILNAYIVTCAGMMVAMVVVVECKWYSGYTCMVSMVVVAGGGGTRWLYVHGIVAVWCGGGGYM